MPDQTFRPQPRSYVAETQAFVNGTSTPRRFLERSLEIAATAELDIRAFEVLDIEGARRQTDASTDRWRAGRPHSPIDGMPLGIKDVIETIGLPTGMGSPLFSGWQSGRDSASVFALREAGGVILGKTVTTEFAATEPGATRNPWDFNRTPGGSSSGSAAATGAGIISAGLGTQVIGSIIRPASYCGCVGYKPTVGALNRGGSHDYMSQSCLGVLGASLPDTWQVALELVQRSGGDPGFPPLNGTSQALSPTQPRALAMLETAGWTRASDASKIQLNEFLRTLERAGVRILHRSSLPLLQEIEDAISDAFRLSQIINAWESRWPLNTYAERDRDKLSAAMQKRLVEAESMSVADYVAAIDKRWKVRSLYARLAADCDACVTLSAPGAAPLGLASTGDPIFAVVASLLGVPALSLPLLEEARLPLGLQLIGYTGRDADLISIATWARNVAAQAA